MDTQRFGEISCGLVQMAVMLPGNQPKGIENICVIRIDGHRFSERRFRLHPAACLRQDESLFAIHLGIIWIGETNLRERT